MLKLDDLISRFTYDTSLYIAEPMQTASAVSGYHLTPQTYFNNYLGVREAYGKLSVITIKAIVKYNKPIIEISLCEVKQ